MSEVVAVALIGVLGTLGAGVVAPIVKAWVDDRVSFRSTRRQRTGDLLAEINAALDRMMMLPLGSPQWWAEKAAVTRAIGELTLILPKGGEEVAATYDSVSGLAARWDDPVDQAVWGLMVSAATAQATRWFRGQRKAKGMTQEVHDFGSLMREGFKDGRVTFGDTDPREGSGVADQS